tara:strand:+ start:124 stop:363 length:240 start_codon:yes stop_codon:yes gene_type:complete
MYLVKIVNHKSDILNPKPVEMGFYIGKDMEYAAIPLANSDTKLTVFYMGKQLKVCRNRKSAMNLIQKHMKGKSIARLPV